MNPRFLRKDKTKSHDNLRHKENGSKQSEGSIDFLKQKKKESATKKPTQVARSHASRPAQLAPSASTPNLLAVRPRSARPVLPSAASNISVLKEREPASSMYNARPDFHRQRPSDSALVPAVPAHAYLSQVGSTGFSEPDADLANRISDRMSVIQASIDEDDAPPAYDAELPQPASSPFRVGPQKRSGRFSKVWLYANSRLPPALPPVKLYIPTYPVLCLCAAHSLAVYDGNPQPLSPTMLGGRPASIATVLPSSVRHGNRALTLTTTPLDTSSHVVVAIRGTASLADWAVNTWSSPASPAGFLSDAGNLVHAGFLHAARATAGPLAARLRMLLAEKPERARASLVLTGHSAGGAVAALLYAHMIDLASSSLEASPLRDVAAKFGRAHCVTFGAPPVTLLPLSKPHPPSGTPPTSQVARRLNKSMFFAFVNEGDPVVRADPTIARSLLALYATTAPVSAAQAPYWPVPPGAFSLAGRVVLLRGPLSGSAQNRSNASSPGPNPNKGRSKGGALAAVLFGRQPKAADSDIATFAPLEQQKVSASQVTDDMLRGAVFGDPVMHSMRLYKERIETLAVSAVTVGAVTV